jgi:ubiquinone/menaquinone biosynthesis C-methylase UbiE
MDDSVAAVKQQIISRYDTEAREKDNTEWYQKGGTERVPESPASHYFIDRKVNQALSMCAGELSPASKVLEIGCSFGHMTSILAKKFDTLTALDISAESIRLAGERLSRYGIHNVRFVVDDAEVLSAIPDNSLDAIFSFSTIRFCPRPAEALQAIYKKLKKGGIAVIDFPNKYSPWHRFVKKAVGIEKHIHDRLFSLQEVIAMLREAGFSIKASKQFLFTTKRLPTGILPLFKGIEIFLESIPFFSHFAGIIMVKGIKE